MAKDISSEDVGKRETEKQVWFHQAWNLPNSATPAGEALMPNSARPAASEHRLGLDLRVMERGQVALDFSGDAPSAPKKMKIVPGRPWPLLPPSHIFVLPSSPLQFGQAEDKEKHSTPTPRLPVPPTSAPPPRSAQTQREGGGTLFNPSCSLSGEGWLICPQHPPLLPLPPLRPHPRPSLSKSPHPARPPPSAPVADSPWLP